MTICQAKTKSHSKYAVLKIPVSPKIHMDPKSRLMHLESQIHGISQPLRSAWDPHHPFIFKTPIAWSQLWNSLLNYGFNMISKGVFNMNGGRDSWNFLGLKRKKKRSFRVRLWWYMGSTTRFSSWWNTQISCPTDSLLQYKLVGGWPTPLKNINQLGLLFPIYEKIKAMFQTTNQQRNLEALVPCRGQTYPESSDSLVRATLHESPNCEVGLTGDV